MEKYIILVLFTLALYKRIDEKSTWLIKMGAVIGFIWVGAVLFVSKAKEGEVK